MRKKRLTVKQQLIERIDGLNAQLKASDKTILNLRSALETMTSRVKHLEAERNALRSAMRYNVTTLGDTARLDARMATIQGLLQTIQRLNKELRDPQPLKGFAPHPLQDLEAPKPNDG